MYRGLYPVSNRYPFDVRCVMFTPGGTQLLPAWSRRLLPDAHATAPGETIAVTNVRGFT